MVTDPRWILRVHARYRFAYRRAAAHGAVVQELPGQRSVAVYRLFANGSTDAIVLYHNFRIALEQLQFGGSVRPELTKHTNKAKQVMESIFLASTHSIIQSR